MWKSQFSRFRQFSTGMLSSILVVLCKNLTIRLSLSNQNRVHSYRILPQPITKLAFSFPYLKIDNPALLIAAIFYYQPPKKDDFLTFPIICAPFKNCQLIASLPLFWELCFLPISCNLIVTILAKRRQQWSKQDSLSFFWLTAKQIYSSLKIAFNFIRPLAMRVNRSFILLRSYIAKGRSFNSIEFTLNSSCFSTQIFIPFFEGVQTSQISLTYFLSFPQVFSRTLAIKFILGFYGFFYKSRDEQEKLSIQSSLKNLVLGVVSVLGSETILSLGLIGTDSSSEELLPNPSFLSFIICSLRACMMALYFSRSLLNCESFSLDYLDESEWVSLLLLLMATGYVFSKP